MMQHILLELFIHDVVKSYRAPYFIRAGISMGYVARFSARVKYFTLVHSVQTGSWTHPASYSVGTGTLPEGKAA
jgi:hypothetical protein